MNASLLARAVAAGRSDDVELRSLPGDVESDAATATETADAASDRPAAAMRMGGVLGLVLMAKKLEKRDPSRDELALNAGAMPVPADLARALNQQAPSDATQLERGRDAVLAVFARPRVNRAFLLLAMMTVVCIVVAAAVMGWAILGLFLRLHNGWSTVDAACSACAAVANLTLASMPQFVPDVQKRCPSLSLAQPAYCTYNQWVFNACIKAFTVLFSYINFLPIPWRLAIAHHAFCSTRTRQRTVGVDFYGRDTDALWFQIPRARRRWISALLNVAWIAHFASLAGHLAYPTYEEGQRWPGAFAQNFPFITSVACQLAAVVAQTRAERHLLGSSATMPPMWPFVRAAWREWRAERRLLLRSSGRGSSSSGHGASGSSCGGGAEAAPARRGLSAIARDHWRQYRMARVHHRLRHSKRCLNALTGIEQPRKPPIQAHVARHKFMKYGNLSEEAAATAIAAAARGSMQRMRSRQQARSVTRIAAVQRGRTERQGRMTQRAGKRLSVIRASLRSTLRSSLRCRTEPDALTAPGQQHTQSAAPEEAGGAAQLMEQRSRSRWALPEGTVTCQ